jgi:hypothetical protein
MHSFAAYLCLVLSVFVAFGQALPIVSESKLPTRNVTLKFNSSEVQYSVNSWEVMSSLPSDPYQSFTFSDVIGATFGVLLPNGTVGVDYIGVPRSSGAAYAICIDCDLVDDTKGSWSLVDGHQAKLINDDQATPTVLFSVVDLDPSVRHVITVTSIPDARFNNTSQITLESLNIKVVDNNGNTEPVETSTGAAKPTKTNEPTDSVSDSAEPTSTSTSDSESQSTSKPSSKPTKSASPESESSATESASETSTSSTATSSSESKPTESVTDSESNSDPTSSSTSASSSSPTASSSPQDAQHDKVPPTTAASGTQKVSNAVIALVVVVCVLALFCLAVALIFIYRIRRKRAAAKTRDAESQAYGNSQWLTPGHMPITGMQEVPLTGTPVRPRNPFEDQFPPDVPLELETPGDSTLMNKRGLRRPRSSFGNGLYDRPAFR